MSYKIMIIIGGVFAGCSMFGMECVDPVSDYWKFKKERDTTIACFSACIKDDWARGRRIVGGKLVYSKDKIDALRMANDPREALKILEQINNDQGDLFQNIVSLTKNLSHRVIEKQEQVNNLLLKSKESN